ncbi:putative transposase [Rhodoferax antarcticus ANT.BR]|uniref:Putative transposase n=1 Tax=Rhodoferax antarcticus ANT.BR TaxID=1111071 RepID=A0A1Q8YHE9_9BURK|nr:putative transposase [Rhodoferax antarcticus ANT.BR]
MPDKADPASLHLGAVAFIHRFGSSLNTHVHFHVCVVDGVFEALPDVQSDSDSDLAESANAASITFHPAQIDDAAIAAVHANVRKRLLRAFVARGHLESHDAKDMAGYAHGGGFSVDAGVRIEAADRAGLERLLRYCARPPFALDRLKQRGADLVYRCGKGHAEPLPSSKYAGELVLTPLELINRIAQLVPPPRTHRHRYYGVLAPNSPLRAAVTAMAQAEQVVAPIVRSSVADAVCTDAGSAGGVPGVSGVDAAAQPEPPAKPKPRPPSHYLWAALIARIVDAFPLLCPMCGGQMRIIAFITFSADIHKILEHIGVDPEAPRITPARGPPLWEGEGAQETGEGVEAEPDWDLANQSPPDYPDDQRTTW